MIEVKDLIKEYKTKDSLVKALNGLSFKINDGQFVTILGKSGSGKTTLLSLLGALDTPTSGEIIVDNQNIAELSLAQLTKYRLNSIGFIFQSYNLIPNLTALENVALALELQHVNKSERLNVAQDLLNSVGINKDQQTRKPAKLSGGQQQRVAIARALANKPKFILADEPTGNLDSESGDNIVKILRDLAKKEGKTIIVVTHDQDIAKKADLKISIKDGQLA